MVNGKIDKAEQCTQTAAELLHLWFNFGSLGRIVIGRKEFERFADLFKIVALFIAIPSQLVKGFSLCENLFSLVCTR